MGEDIPALRLDLVTQLQKEDFTPLSVIELKHRITALQAEIARTETHLTKASAVKLDAEALFRKEKM